MRLTNVLSLKDFNNLKNLPISMLMLGIGSDFFAKSSGSLEVA